MNTDTGEVKLNVQTGEIFDFAEAAANGAAIRRVIPGLRRYAIDIHGRIWSRRSRRSDTWRLLRPSLAHGYLQTSRLTKDDGTCRSFYVQQLVMLAFSGPPPRGKQVCHNDGNPLNNRLDNLRYGTPTSNSRDRWLHGTMLTRDHGHSGAKLSSTDVSELRLRCRSERVIDVANHFGITLSHAYKLRGSTGPK